MPTTRDAAAAYLAAVEAEKEIKKQKAQAAEALREAYAKAGVNAVIVNDHKVALVPVVTTTIDVDGLKDYAPEAVFEQVTKTAVDMKQWHAAVAVGMVSGTLAEKVVTEKFTDRIEVDLIV